MRILRGQQGCIKLLPTFPLEVPKTHTPRPKGHTLISPASRLVRGCKDAPRRAHLGSARFPPVVGAFTLLRQKKPKGF